MSALRHGPRPDPATQDRRVWLDVELTPRVAGHGISQLRLAVRDPETGGPVTAFTRVHERPFHMFVISRDLSRFAHVHPEQDHNGAFTLTHDLPPGEYVLIADFLPAGGTPQMVHRAIVTPGYAGPLFSPPPDLAPSTTEQVVDGVRIAVHTPALSALKRSRVEFTFADAATGAQLTDLEPYLGASAHLLVVTPDLTHAIHGHPEGTLTSGPTVVFEPLLPVSGAYKMWVQVQRRGRVTTVPFVVNVK